MTSLASLPSFSAPRALIPVLAGDSASIQILNEVMLSLTELDPDTREPELAASWVSSEGGAVFPQISFELEYVDWGAYLFSLRPHAELV